MPTPTPSHSDDSLEVSGHMQSSLVSLVYTNTEAHRPSHQAIGTSEDPEHVNASTCCSKRPKGKHKQTRPM